MITITNLTPHPVTIIRPNRDPVTYPACAATDLPRATESAEYPADLAAQFIGAPDHKISIGLMELADAGSDGQGGYENYVTLDKLGFVDFVGYTGVEGLPPLPRSETMFGLGTFRIVSIVTALGALVAGRGIEDLLIPMGQVRDDNGRVIGATGLAPATALLSPLVMRLTHPIRREVVIALEERNKARRAAERLP